MLDSRSPLPHRLRPTTLDEFIGQEHILGPGTLLRTMIESDKLKSALLFGPPGTGKSTLANIIANRTQSSFIKMNATNAGVSDVRDSIKRAKVTYDLNNKRTVVWVDECLPYDALVYIRCNGLVTTCPIGAVVDNRMRCDILSYDGNVPVWSNVGGWFVRKSKPMIELVIDDDGRLVILQCSEDHLVYTNNRGYIEARNLTESDDIAVLRKDIMKGVHQFAENTHDMPDMPKAIRGICAGQILL